MSAGQAHSSPSGAAEHSSWKGVDLATNLPRKKRDVLKRYGLALAFAALALLIRGVLPVPTGTTIYQLPLAAVVLSGWIGGRGPGLLASLISVLGVLYWFIPPLYSFHISPDFQLPVAIFIGLCVLLTEVGEARSRVKRALEESEGRFRLMAETVPEMLWFQSVEPPKMLYVSPRYEEIWGRPFGDPKSRTIAWLEAVHPEERNGVRSAYERWLSGEGSGRLDATFRIVRPDGETRWIHSRGTLIRDKHGKPYRASGIAEDVTEEKRAQEALAKAQTELRARQEMLDLAQKAARAVAFDRQVAAPDSENRWSPELEALYGLEPGAYDGSYGSWKKLVYPDDWPSVKLALQRAVKFGELAVEYRVVHRDGTMHWLRARGRIICDAEGQPVRMVGFMIDVTDRWHAEERLREKEEALDTARTELARVSRVTTLGELTASIAHEVAQPLGAMIASAAAGARWLAAEPPDIAEVRSALDNIAADGMRAREVIARIRALTKRQMPRKEMLDINQEILEVLALTERELRGHDIVLRTQLDRTLPRVAGDRVQLQQVLINLIMNAIEAMSGVCDHARELTIVSAQDGPKSVTVEVRDSGTGLDPKGAERVFEAFYTTKAEGIGIGLSISRSIIEAHSGRLWASPNEPHGAVFRFSLPVTEEAVS